MARNKTKWYILRGILHDGIMETIGEPYIHYMDAIQKASHYINGGRYAEVLVYAELYTGEMLRKRRVTAEKQEAFSVGTERFSS